MSESPPLIERIYLDWNIFNKLEHLEELEVDEKEVYGYIDGLLSQNLMIAPYSNAHINDLIRGYEKNPSYTPGHLRNITRLTHNICIAQYWNESTVKWHLRDPEEFLHSRMEEELDISTTYSGLYDSLNEPSLSLAFDLKKLQQRMTPVPAAFKEGYATNPIFGIMYPRTRTEMNMLALCEDLYSFSYQIRNDFQLYKHFRKFLNELKVKYPQFKEIMSQVLPNQKPDYLTWDEMWDAAEPQFKPHQNAYYDKITSLFTTTDLKGYKQDKKFANLLDDALHCFYAAHCHYFITKDANCYHKAKLVYKNLKINCKVFTPVEFVKWRAGDKNENSD